RPVRLLERGSAGRTRAGARRAVHARRGHPTDIGSGPPRAGDHVSDVGRQRVGTARPSDRSQPAAPGLHGDVHRQPDRHVRRSVAVLDRALAGMIATAPDADLQRAVALRRMKLIALGLLLAAATIYV